MANARQLELKQVVLARVGIDRNDARTRECVVEGVAASAGNDENAVQWSEPESRAVDRRILPALVVDKVVAVDQVEEAAGRDRSSQGKHEGCCSVQEDPVDAASDHHADQRPSYDVAQEVQPHDDARGRDAAGREDQRRRQEGELQTQQRGHGERVE